MVKYGLEYYSDSECTESIRYSQVRRSFKYSTRVRNAMPLSSEKKEIDIRIQNDEEHT